ncbi:MAG: hypothetical protein M5U34_11045 [Chloroflexi bacterium]|nr:hypothetical protein [Chloroflexota bacterium]
MAQINHKPVNILFTSAGRRVELLLAFRQAYKALALPGHIIATDIDPLAPALHAADRFYMTPVTLTRSMCQPYWIFVSEKPLPCYFR